MEKLTITVAEAAEMIGVSKPTIYRITEQQNFPVLRAGRKKVIPIAEFKQWVSNQVQPAQQQRS